MNSLKLAARSLEGSSSIALLKNKDDLAVATSDLAKLSITSFDMVLVAVLIRGDYNTKGLKRCGEDTALALARAGAGESLHRAYLSTKGRYEKTVKKAF